MLRVGVLYQVTVHPVAAVPQQSWIARSVARMSKFALASHAPNVGAIRGASVGRANVLRALAAASGVELVFSVPGGGTDFAPPTPAQHPIHAEGRAEPVDVWFTADSLGALVPLMAVADATTPASCLAHGFPGGSRQHNWFVRLILHNPRPFDAVVCHSEAASSALINSFEMARAWIAAQTGSSPEFRARVAVIPGCVDTEALTPGPKDAARRKLGITSTAMLLVWVGRIAQDKSDLTALVRVVARIRRRVPSLELVIAGTAEASECARLSALAASAGVSRAVHLMLAPSEEAKLDLLRAADLLVATSESAEEGFGLTLVEAMATGLPVVASDWSGYREVLAHGAAGFLVPTFTIPATIPVRAPSLPFAVDDLADTIRFAKRSGTDPRLLEETICMILANSHLRNRIGDAARRRAVAMYSAPAVAREYVRLWEELVVLARANPALPSRAPRWERCMEHFATLRLGPTTVLGPVPDGLTHDVALDGSSGEIPTSVHRFLGFLRKRGGPCTFADLAAAEMTCDPDYELAIAWLVRHGLVRLGHTGDFGPLTGA